jgi:hypothetical protein
VADYRLITRGGKGVINIRCTERNGDVIAIKEVKDGDELIMITQQGTSIRFSIDSLREIGRATQGVRLHDLGEEDKIVMVERIQKEVGDKEDGADEPEDELNLNGEDNARPKALLPRPEEADVIQATGREGYGDDEDADADADADAEPEDLFSRGASDSEDADEDE